jgi:dTDP-4-dehydrorhamnose reductase
MILITGGNGQLGQELNAILDVEKDKPNENKNAKSTIIFSLLCELFVIPI